MNHEDAQDTTARTAAPDAAQLRHDLGFYSHVEVCAILDVTTGTGYNRRAQGDWPPSIRTGRSALYPIDKFRRWLASRRAR